MQIESYKPKPREDRLSIRISPELNQFLIDLSHQSKVRKSDIVRSMIEHCKALSARGGLNLK